MKKKKQISTAEQKAKNKIYQKEWAKKNKAKRKIYNAEYHLKNKAKHKIKKAKWYQENKEDQNRQAREWTEANPNYKKEWYKKNPSYISPCKIENPNYAKEWVSQHDLGYWIVYIIHDYNGRGDEYCGMTQNIYMRMAQHKSLGKLNTDTYTIVKKCDTLEDALEIESAVHNFGYHGYNNGK